MNPEQRKEIRDRLDAFDRGGFFSRGPAFRAIQNHALGDIRALDAEVSRLEGEAAKEAKRFERVCDVCGGVVRGNAEFPCVKCGSLKGQSLLLAYFDLRGAARKLLQCFPETIPSSQEELSFNIPAYIVRELRAAATPQGGDDGE